MGGHDVLDVRKVGFRGQKSPGLGFEAPPGRFWLQVLQRISHFFIIFIVPLPGATPTAKRFPG
jgi:hypothetical protein